MEGGLPVYLIVSLKKKVVQKVLFLKSLKNYFKELVSRRAVINGPNSGSKPDIRNLSQTISRKSALPFYLLAVIYTTPNWEVLPCLSNIPEFED